MTAIEDWLAAKSQGAGLGPKATRVVEVIKTQPRLAAYASTADLAARASVNVATVVRAAQALGFNGWPHLRLEVRNRFLATLTANEVLEQHSGTVTNPVVDALRRDIANLEFTARSVDVEAIRGVAAAVSGASKTVVVGSGSFAAPGIQLAHIASFMGLDVRLERHGGTQLANAVAHLGSPDCLVVFNFWWQPREVASVVRLAHAHDVTICLVTDRLSSHIAELATHVVVVASEGVSSFPSLTPAMAVVHAILAEIAHHGGSSLSAAVARTESAWAGMGLFDESR